LLLARAAALLETSEQGERTAVSPGRSTCGVTAGRYREGTTDGTEDERMMDDDEEPRGEENVAIEVRGFPACPYCGDTLTGIRSDGYATCMHEGIEVWVPPSLR
jgi:hypothetical protein